jgi:hypothetical protein
MNSLARHIASTGPHRNLSRVFRGQLRHTHDTAGKKPIAFRWEVRVPPPTPVIIVVVFLMAN